MILKKSGFTLLEILVALSIFTLVAMMMATGLHTILASQSQLEAKTKRLAELQMALLLLSRDIEQIIDRPITNAKGEVEQALVGGLSNVAFTHGGVTNPLNQRTQSSLQRTRYLLDQNQLLRETSAVLDQTANTTYARRLLLQHVDDLQLNYLDDHGHFQNQWPPFNGNANHLPHAIRITLILKNWGKISQLYLIPGPNIEKPH